jgi:hypothetical protein
VATALPRLNPVTVARHAGARVILRTLAEQAWGDKRFFGLRADLSRIPDVRPAAFPITMQVTDAPSFRGFREELDRVEGDDYVQVLLRTMTCEAAIETLYVATDEQGRPAYAQWLTRARDQAPVHEHSPGRYPVLHDDEVLLEGAYTFIAFRRMGMMADGMVQLLKIARDEGCTAAYTYVEADNIPSLRGCANVGFDLDHVRHNLRRFGRHRSSQQKPTADDLAQWARATAPRS